MRGVYGGWEGGTGEQRQELERGRTGLDGSDAEKDPGSQHT